MLSPPREPVERAARGLERHGQPDAGTPARHVLAPDEQEGIAEASLEKHGVERGTEQGHQNPRAVPAAPAQVEPPALQVQQQQPRHDQNAGDPRQPGERSGQPCRPPAFLLAEGEGTHDRQEKERLGVHRPQEIGEGEERQQQDRAAGDGRLRMQPHQTIEKNQRRQKRSVGDQQPRQVDVADNGGYRTDGNRVEREEGRVALAGLIQGQVGVPVDGDAAVPLTVPVCPWVHEQGTQSIRWRGRSRRVGSALSVGHQQHACGDDQQQPGSAGEKDDQRCGVGAPQAERPPPIALNVARACCLAFGIFPRSIWVQRAPGVGRTTAGVRIAASGDSAIRGVVEVGGRSARVRASRARLHAPGAPTSITYATIVS